MASMTGAGPAASPQEGAAPRPLPQSSSLWVVATAILLPFGVVLAGIGWLFGMAGLWMGTPWKLWELPHTGPATEPTIPGLPLAATVAVACLPVAVAVYFLVAGLRRGPRQG